MKIKQILPLLEFVVKTRYDIVYRNPTVEQLVNLSNNTKYYLRGIVSGNDVYFWNSYNATHLTMARELGIPFEDKHGDDIIKLDMANMNGSPVIACSEEVEMPDIFDKPPLKRYFKSGEIKIRRRVVD